MQSFLADKNGIVESKLKFLKTKTIIDIIFKGNPAHLPNISLVNLSYIIRGSSSPQLSGFWVLPPIFFFFFKNLFSQEQCKYAMDIEDAHIRATINRFFLCVKKYPLIFMAATAFNFYNNPWVIQGYKNLCQKRAAI